MKNLVKTKNNDWEHSWEYAWRFEIRIYPKRWHNVCTKGKYYLSIGRLMLGWFWIPNRVYKFFTKVK